MSHARRIALLALLALPTLAAPPRRQLVEADADGRF